MINFCEIHKIAFGGDRCPLCFAEGETIYGLNQVIKKLIEEKEERDYIIEKLREKHSDYSIVK